MAEVAPTVDRRLWHGGVPGLEPGDPVLPPSATGNHRLANGFRDVTRATPGLDPAAVTPEDTSPDWVYFTPNRRVALAYAAACEKDYGTPGALYVVEPVGAVEPDPDMPVQGLRAHAARVVTVYDPCVRLPDARVAYLLAAVVAAERGTTAKRQRAGLARLMRNAQRSSRPGQTLMITTAQDRGGA